MNKEEWIKNVIIVLERIKELETELYFCYRNKKIEDEIQKR